MSGSMSAPTSSRTTSPKRRRRSSSSTARSRSSASSETVKSASRVTRKTSWRRISMPGKSCVEVAGDHASRAGRTRPSPIGDEARQHLLRHLHAREASRCPSTGSRSHTARRQREVRDVRERPPGPDGQRRQHREDLLVEVPVDRLAAPRASQLLAVDDADALLGQRGAHRALPLARVALRPARGRARRSARSSRPATARRAARASMPASTWSCRPATRTMKNSSRLVA